MRRKAFDLTLLPGDIMPDVPAPPRKVLQGEVVYHRPPGPLTALDVVEFLSFLMDRCFELPGTKLRFGFNSLLLLVPVLGDAVAGAISLFILTLGLSNHQVPRIVAARMVLNSLLDATVSWIPVVGNVWDVYFKADTRNVRLLREYAGTGEPRRATWRHWLFVVGVLAGYVAVLALLVWGVVVLTVAGVQALRRI